MWPLKKVEKSFPFLRCHVATTEKLSNESMTHDHSFLKETSLFFAFQPTTYAHIDFVKSMENALKLMGFSKAKNSMLLGQLYKAQKIFYILQEK